MAQKFWKTDDFKTLDKEWSQKLAESGFQDAEKEIAGERTLRQTSDYAYRRKEHTQTYRDAKLSYFLLIAHHMTAAKFDDESDRLIMEWTADGKTIREISTELKKLGWHKFNRDTIRYIRRRYEHRWEIRHWKPEQMVSRKAPIASLPSPPEAFPLVIATLSSRSGRGR